MQSGAKVAYSVQKLGYRLDDPEFVSWQGQDFYVVQNVQTGCGARPASSLLYVLCDEVFN
jgi:hypothetical protein